MPEYVIKEDRHGNPVVHSKKCFCLKPDDDTYLASADSLAELAESFEADAIAAGVMTKNEAHALMKIAQCIDNSHCPGVGRRYSSYMPKLQVETFGEWAASLSKVPDLPRLKFAEVNLKPGRPASSHADCDHPRDRKSRAVCRKLRARQS